MLSPRGWYRCPYGERRAPNDDPAGSVGRREHDRRRFLDSLAEETEAGIALLRLLEREWFAARSAVHDRRRDSHAAAAVDAMAAAPVLSATTLTRGLRISVKNAAALLDSLVARGIAIEVTHRSKRRLFGLKHLAPLREEALPPRRARRGRINPARRRGTLAGHRAP